MSKNNNINIDEIEVIEVITVNEYEVPLTTYSHCMTELMNQFKYFVNENRDKLIGDVSENNFNYHHGNSYIEGKPYCIVSIGVSYKEEFAKRILIHHKIDSIDGESPSFPTKPSNESNVANDSIIH